MVCPSGRWKACGGPFYGHCMSSGLTRTPLSWGGGGCMNREVFWSEGSGKGIQSWLPDKFCIPLSPTPQQGFLELSLHPFILWPLPLTLLLLLFLKTFLWMSLANKTSPFPSIHALPLQPICLLLSFSPSQTIVSTLLLPLARCPFPYIASSFVFSRRTYTNTLFIRSFMHLLLSNISRPAGFPLFEPDNATHCLPRPSRSPSRDPTLSMINNCPGSIVRRPASGYQKATSNFSKGGKNTTTPIFLS